MRAPSPGPTLPVGDTSDMLVPPAENFLYDIKKVGPRMQVVCSFSTYRESDLGGGVVVLGDYAAAEARARRDAAFRQVNGGRVDDRDISRNVYHRWQC